MALCIRDGRAGCCRRSTKDPFNELFPRRGFLSRVAISSNRCAIELYLIDLETEKAEMVRETVVSQLDSGYCNYACVLQGYKRVEVQLYMIAISVSEKGAAERKIVRSLCAMAYH